MDTTQVTQAEMDQTAKRFESVSTELDDMLSRLLDRLSGLQREWVGAGGRSFETTKIAWTQHQQDLHKRLAETTTAIRSAGTNYMAADSAAATNMSRPRGGIELAL